MRPGYDGTSYLGKVGISATLLDSFSRVRVSPLQNLFSASFEYDAQPLLFSTSTSGSGSIAKTSGETSLTLSVGTDSGATAINQTKAYFRYEPSKSQLVLATGIIGAQKTGVTSRLGYYDANNGVFFEMNGSLGIRIVQRSNTSGSPVDTAVNQVNWDIDRLDGTGPSGYNLDFSKTQIFIIDFQWLGVGRVRYGFDIHGTVIYCHETYNDNIQTSPYSNTANLPLRAEIVNTAITASTTAMKQICFSVSAESNQDFPAAYGFTAANAATAIAVTTRRPILSIRPKLTFDSLTNRARIDLSFLQILASTSPCYWELVYNGTLTGSSFNSVNASSVVEFDIASTAITNGISVISGYTASGTGQNRAITQVNAVPSKLPFALDITGTVQDVYTLVVTGIGGTSNVLGSIDWNEQR